MNSDLFSVAAPLRAAFRVEPFSTVLGSVHVEGESFLHELCHVVTLERQGIKVSLRDSHKRRSSSDSLSIRLGNAINALTLLEAARNECETLAVEVVLLEAYGHVEASLKDESLTSFLRDVWEGQPTSMRVALFARSFRRFREHVLALVNTPETKAAARSVIRRTYYWKGGKLIRNFNYLDVDKGTVLISPEGQTYLVVKKLSRKRREFRVLDGQKLKVLRGVWGDGPDVGTDGKHWTMLIKSK